MSTCLKNSINATKINKTAKTALKNKKRGSPEFCCHSERYGRRRALVDLYPIANAELDGCVVGRFTVRPIGCLPVVHRVIQTRKQVFRFRASCRAIA